MNKIKKGMSLAAVIGILASLTLVITTIFSISTANSQTVNKALVDTEAYKSAVVTLENACKQINAKIPELENKNDLLTYVAAIEIAYGVKIDQVSTDTFKMSKTDNNGKTYSTSFTFKTTGDDKLEDILFSETDKVKLTYQYSYENLMIQYLYEIVPEMVKLYEDSASLEDLEKAKKISGNYIPYSNAYDPELIGILKANIKNEYKNNIVAFYDSTYSSEFGSLYDDANFENFFNNKFSIINLPQKKKNDGTYYTPLLKEVISIELYKYSFNYIIDDFLWNNKPTLSLNTETGTQNTAPDVNIAGSYFKKDKVSGNLVSTNILTSFANAGEKPVDKDYYVISSSGVYRGNDEDTFTVKYDLSHLTTTNTTLYLDQPWYANYKSTKNYCTSLDTNGKCLNWSNWYMSYTQETSSINSNSSAVDWKDYMIGKLYLTFDIKDIDETEVNNNASSDYYMDPNSAKTKYYYNYKGTDYLIMDEDRNIYLTVSFNVKKGGKRYYYGFFADENHVKTGNDMLSIYYDSSKGICYGNGIILISTAGVLKSQGQSFSGVNNASVNGANDLGSSIKKVTEQLDYIGDYAKNLGNQEIIKSINKIIGGTEDALKARYKAITSDSGVPYSDDMISKLNMWKYDSFISDLSNSMNSKTTIKEKYILAYKEILKYKAYLDDYEYAMQNHDSLQVVRSGNTITMTKGGDTFVIADSITGTPEYYVNESGTLTYNNGSNTLNLCGLFLISTVNSDNETVKRLVDRYGNVIVDENFAIYDPNDFIIKKNSDKSITITLNDVDYQIFDADGNKTNDSAILLVLSNNGLIIDSTTLRNSYGTILVQNQDVIKYFYGNLRNNEDGTGDFSLSEYAALLANYVYSEETQLATKANIFYIEYNDNAEEYFDTNGVQIYLDYVKLTNKTIYITNNSVVYINGGLVMGNGAHIVVEQGSVLYINGSLTMDSTIYSGGSASDLASFSSGVYYANELDGDGNTVSVRHGDDSKGTIIINGGLNYKNKYSSSASTLKDDTNLYNTVIGKEHALCGNFIVNGDVKFYQDNGTVANNGLIISIGGLFGWGDTNSGATKVTVEATFYVNGKYDAELSTYSLGIVYASERPSFIFTENLTLGGGLGGIFNGSNANADEGYVFFIPAKAPVIGSGFTRLQGNLLTADSDISGGNGYSEDAQQAIIDNDGFNLDLGNLQLSVIDRIDSKTGAQINNTANATEWGLAKLLRDGLVVGIENTPIKAE